MKTSQGNTTVHASSLSTSPSDAPPECDIDLNEVFLEFDHKLSKYAPKQWVNVTSQQIRVSE